MSRTSYRLIDTDDDIRSGVRALNRHCRVMKRLLAVTGPPPLRRRPAGFEGLCRIVVAQQLSTASAGAIWNRLEQAFPSVSPVDILDADDAALRRIGLSGGKIRTLRATARAVADGLDLEALDASSDDEIRSALCAISGIGPWTADIYVMFCLGRADAFAAGDLALQIAAQHAFGREGRPSPAELLDLAEAWRPWRGVAARVLWAWYPNIRRTKQPEPV